MGEGSQGHWGNLYN